MIYTYTDTAELYVAGDILLLSYDVSYRVIKGYPATQIDPEAFPDVNVISARMRCKDGKQMECPDWLRNLFEPSVETLLANADEQAESAADDAADARWEMRRLDATS